MAKNEMEKEIMNRLNALVAEHNERDREHREWMNKEIENGTDKEFFTDMFFYNGYIYTSELEDILSVVLFGHNAEERIQYDRRFHGVPRGRNYRNILTEEERVKLNKVAHGMINANIIKLSKSGAMVKVL